MKKIVVLFIVFVTMQCSASDVGLFSKEEFITYCAARKVADIIFEIMLKDCQGDQIDDRRQFDVNPRYDRTRQGLFLEFYDTWPNVIRTPWGRWPIYNGALWHKPFGVSVDNYREQQKKEILEKLPLQEVVGLKEINLFGPIFKICFDTIPEATFGPEVPRIINKKTGGIYTQDHFEMIEKWRAMTDLWKKQSIDR